MEVTFQKQVYRLILTDHAIQYAAVRNVTLDEIIDIIETGATKLDQVTAKGVKHWAYKYYPTRTDNFIALTVAVEGTELVVINVMVDWEPK